MERAGVVAVVAVVVVVVVAFVVVVCGGVGGNMGRATNPKLLVHLRMMLMVLGGCGG